MTNQPASDPFSSLGAFFRSPLFPIFMIVFVDMLGVGITFPVIPLYAKNVFSASASEVTGLTSIYFLAQFIAAPQLGRLSDRIGRRPVLVFSQIGTFMALVLSGATPGLFFLYVARTIDGLTGGNISVAQAYLNDVTDEDNRTRGLGLIFASFSMGLFVGPAMGGLLAAQFGPRVPFFVAACISLFTISMTYLKLPESLTPERRAALEAQHSTSEDIPGEWERFLNLVRIPGVVLMLFIGFGAQFSFFTFQSIWVLWAEAVVLAGRDPDYIQRAVGIVFTIFAVFGMVSQVWLVGPASKHLGEKVMITGGLVGRTMAYTTVFLFPAVIPALLAIPLLVIGGGIANPAITSLITMITPGDQRGHAIGLLQASQNIGRILGPFLAGRLFSMIAPGAPMAAAMLIAGLTVLLCVLGLPGLKVLTTKQRTMLRERPAGLTR